MFRKICLLAFALSTISLVSADVCAKGGHGKGGQSKGGQAGGRGGAHRTAGPRSTHQVRSQTPKRTDQRTQISQRPTSHGPSKSHGPSSQGSLKSHGPSKTHGPSKGHGSSKFDRRSSGKGHPPVGESSADHSHTGKTTEHADTSDTTDHADTGTTPEYDKWRAKEERKLQHRRQVAEHLRQVADRNGNQNLRDVADRMDQKAQEHYDKQMRKRYGEEPADEELPGDDVADEEMPTDESPIDESPIEESPTDEQGTEDTAGETPEPGNTLPQIRKKLTGRQNALYRQWRNEERKLAKSLEAAERLRDLAETTGDPSLLQSAERIEQTALDRYTSRMEKVWDFQERFGLPTPEEFVTAPTPEDVTTLPTSVEQ